MIENLFEIFLTLWSGIRNVVDILSQEFTVFGMNITGLQLIFGEALITILICKIILYCLDSIIP